MTKGSNADVATLHSRCRHWSIVLDNSVVIHRRSFLNPKLMSVVANFTIYLLDTWCKLMEVDNVEAGSQSASVERKIPIKESRLIA